MPHRVLAQLMVSGDTAKTRRLFQSVQSHVEEVEIVRGHYVDLQTMARMEASVFKVG